MSTNIGPPHDPPRAEGGAAEDELRDALLGLVRALIRGRDTPRHSLGGEPVPSPGWAIEEWLAAEGERVDSMVEIVMAEAIGPASPDLKPARPPELRRPLPERLTAFLGALDATALRVLELRLAGAGSRETADQLGLGLRLVQCISGRIGEAWAGAA